MNEKYNEEFKNRNEITRYRQEAEQGDAEAQRSGGAA